MHVVIAGLLGLGTAKARAAEPLSSVDPFDELGLARALWQRSAELAAGREQLIEADANRRRAYLVPNPTLTGSWATIPINRRNPPEIGFWQVPNYNVQIAELLEIGKRAPRQRAAEAAAMRARHELADIYRQAFFTMLEMLSDQAEAVIRGAVLQRLVGDSAEGLRLQRARAQRGDVAGLDVDRLEVEHLRLQSSVAEAASVREAAIARCTQLLGLPCPRFGNDADAQRFLSRADLPTPTPEVLDQRPDIQALADREAQANAEHQLATRQKIPDPTLSLGYQRDQFVAAGNQGNSVNVAVSIPLPMFDRGQVAAARADRARELATSTRMTLLANAAAVVDLARKRIVILMQRASTLDAEAIPRARGVFERMEAAARRGGAALQDVLLARRALEELQLDRVTIAAERFRAIVDGRRAAGLLPPVPASNSDSPYP
ncbi:MAG TPA: TolC family protein [Polyangia bacterium]|jgi:cobalt-zinc-cadmium efflux system outer membrane protein|nr:TolC family protein [Polyangia bacterium]